MIDLDARLTRGPLRVRSLWSAPSHEAVVGRIDRRRRWSLLLDVAVVCACIALAVALPWRLPASTAHEGPKVTVFADGSTAELSTPGSELRIEQDAATGSVARLTGGARFQVVHNPERTFEVRAGDVRVRVLGTTFSVQQLPSGQTQVLVERGRVEVAWLGGATVLQTGQGGVFPPAAGAAGDPEAASVDAPQGKPATSSSPSGAHGGVPPAASDGWRKDGRAGDYGKAYEELTSKGSDSVRDDAGDLMLAADIARLSGHPEDSIRSLRAVCDRHASDRRAPVAAFTLGRVLDDLGRPAEAGAAFQKARVLWPSGPLSEDALSREADAWQRAGRADGARTAAETYLQRYPKGRHAASMRKILGQ
jgi:transmembrane sensor